MIEEGVHDDAGAERECKQVGDGVCRREVERRVLVIGGEVEFVVPV